LEIITSPADRSACQRVAQASCSANSATQEVLSAFGLNRNIKRHLTTQKIAILNAWSIRTIKFELEVERENIACAGNAKHAILKFNYKK